jgi:tRNA(His) 5'-end guanylyltransferase
MMAGKGNASRVSLGDRMKEFEMVHTQTSLVPGIPVYVRIDGRSFHTFTRGLQKPFDPDFAWTMKETTKHLHDKTNAFISYVQSDEISLAYLEPSKMPFETRLFKLESVLAGMASAAFCIYGSKTKLKDRIEKFIPHFDCRVCQMPLEEIPNMLLFRERDCLKNAITLESLEHFSNKQIHKKNSEEKIEMLKGIGIDFSKDIDEDFRYGSWFRRVVFQKELDAETLAKIPEKQRKLDENGKMVVTRSEVRQIRFGMPLSKIENKLEVILGAEDPLEKTS